MASLPESITLVPSDPSSAPGSVVSLTVNPLGCTTTHLVVRDRDGKERDVVLGFDSVDALAEAMSKPGWAYLGSTVGRVANRIAKSTFSLNGTTYQLAHNEPAATLHGGGAPHGYDSRLFTVSSSTKSTAVFSLTDKDGAGANGFPGTLSVEVHVAVSQTSVQWTYHAKPADNKLSTPVSLANHTYFNLSGFTDPVVVAGLPSTPTSPGHHVSFPANIVTSRLELAGQLPTGAVLPLSAPHDFVPGRELSATSWPADPSDSGSRPGWDDYYPVSRALCESAWSRDAHPPSALALNDMVTVSSPTTGIALTVRSTEPGFQLYTGQWIDTMARREYKAAQAEAAAGAVGTEASGKLLYGRYAGLAVEPSGYVNAVNVDGWRGQCVIKEGMYEQRLVWAFGAK